jgi:hypothetical protein
MTPAEEARYIALWPQGLETEEDARMESQNSRVDRLKGNSQELDLKTLLAALEERAVARADGHLTIMRFTTGWKVLIGTPDYSYRSEIEVLPAYTSLYEAILGVLATQR